MVETMKQGYRRWARISLILVYLVILAGAVVRMTGSGMGCPDWPKCFGYLIPPTQEAELYWSPGREFSKGQVIIREEQLLLAKEDFTAGEAFDAAHWEPYTRHDYATFNAFHTWTEYINRLLGALSGLAILIMAICSLAWWRERKSRVLFAWLTVAALGFQAWLGATVVYSVLAPWRITVHMFMALVIVGMLLWIIHRSANPTRVHLRDRTTYLTWWLTVGFSLFQILMGTQVRQFVDEQAESMGSALNAGWLSDAPPVFYIHRSFSVVLLLMHLYVAFRVYRYQLGYNKIFPTIGVLLMILLSGVAMNYLDFPWGSQPVHLVTASVLFGFQWYVLLEMRQAARTRISL